MQLYVVSTRPGDCLRHICMMPADVMAVILILDEDQSCYYCKIFADSPLNAVFKRSTVWVFSGPLGEYGNWILLAVMWGKQSPSSAPILSTRRLEGRVPRHRSHSFNLWRKGQIVARRTCKDWKQARSIPGRRLHPLLCRDQQRETEVYGRGEEEACSIYQIIWSTRR